MHFSVPRSTFHKSLKLETTHLASSSKMENWYIHTRKYCMAIRVIYEHTRNMGKSHKCNAGGRSQTRKSTYV